MFWEKKPDPCQTILYRSRTFRQLRHLGIILREKLENNGQRSILDSRFGFFLSASRFVAIRRIWHLAIRAIRDSTNSGRGRRRRWSPGGTRRARQPACPAARRAAPAGQTPAPAPSPPPPLPTPPPPATNTTDIIARPPIPHAGAFGLGWKRNFFHKAIYIIRECAVPSYK